MFHPAASYNLWMWEPQLLKEAGGFARGHLPWQFDGLVERGCCFAAYLTWLRALGGLTVPAAGPPNPAGLPSICNNNRGSTYKATGMIYSLVLLKTQMDAVLQSCPTEALKRESKNCPRSNVRASFPASTTNSQTKCEKGGHSLWFTPVAMESRRGWSFCGDGPAEPCTFFSATPPTPFLQILHMWPSGSSFLFHILSCAFFPTPASASLPFLFSPSTLDGPPWWAALLEQHSKQQA